MLPARPNVKIPELAIAESNSPSKFTLPAKPNVKGLGLAITDDNDLPSVARSFVMSNQFFSNNPFVINGVLDSGGRNDGSQVCPGTRVKPNSYGASMWQSPITYLDSPWPGVAAGDPRSIGRPPHWRRMNEGRADPRLGLGSHGDATQNLINIDSAAFDRLADRCPTCSADLEPRDRTLGLTLFTCPFCHTERPRQVDVSLQKVPTAWTPPVRVPTTPMLSIDHFTQTRSQSPPQYQPKDSYRQRPYSSATDSDFDVLDDRYKPYHFREKYSKMETYHEEWKKIHRKFWKKRRKLKQTKDNA